MDEKQNTEPRSVNPRRKKRSQAEIFKEAYLPSIIACAAIVLIIIFIIGSITRSIQHNKYEKQMEANASAATENKLVALEAEANLLAELAAIQAEGYDYEAAIETIESFSGFYSDFPILAERHSQYTQALSEMVVWDDPSEILNLSVHMLIAEPQRAYNYSDSYLQQKFKENFITTTEFQNLLQQLYSNGYILIDIEDITTGTESKSISLPTGKKPFILTQTNVNYYNYMIGDNDNYIPDATGAGFASRLIIDANGNITCEMVNAQGETVNGAFDMVPILESFIQTHPDFSYRGARAILAVSGYDGIFGYRINHSAINDKRLTSAQYEKETDGAREVCDKLRTLGYHLACYTYENTAYGDMSASSIHEDMKLWVNEIEPILGKTPYFVFALNSDIGAAGVAYSGDKFNALKSYGFTHYFGFCNANNRWYYQDSNYMRQGRLQITGAMLSQHADWYAGIFDPAEVLESGR